MVPVVSLIAFPLPSATIALFYLTLVVVFAIRFSLLTSIFTAISSFLAFAIFFADHYGSLKIRQEEDFLTAVFFLITAFVVGHLASRHNKNVQEIRLREKLSYIGTNLLEQLAQALNQEQVIKSLEMALADFSDDCQIIRLTPDMQMVLPEHIKNIVADNNLRPETLEKFSSWEEQKNVYILHDKHRILAVLNMRSESVPHITKDAFRMLIHQANIALERSRLIADLEQEKIEKENELLRSALLSSISHDFRTPLTTMIGATSTVLEMGEQLAKSQVQELLETVIAEAERLNRYTQNLLDMTRLGLGQLRLERDWISMEEIVNTLNKRIKPLLETVKLDIRIDADLPLLDIHAALIEQALFNILDNAIKFAPVNSTILLMCRREQESIVTLIADEGPGVPESEREKVFERFYTAARGDRRKSGSGLGLTICRGMFNAHGGQVNIYSNDDPRCQPLPDFLPATGCCVRTELPISNAEKSFKTKESINAI